LTPAVVGAGILVWIGATLLLSASARLARPSLVERVRPFHPSAGTRAPIRPRSRLVGQPLDWKARAVGVGDRAAAVLGVGEGAERRLRRIHSSTSAPAFRSRQLVASLMVMTAMAVGSLAGGAGPALSAFLVFGGGTLTFLLIEEDLNRRSDRWKSTTEAEVAVVAEQLAMLLNSGCSLGVALGRLAARGRGCVARDVALVANRVAQGLSEGEALAEWAERAGVEAVTRLVGVLSLHSEAADLGRLVTAEARRARREQQRRLVEAIERRGQQIWVPVTVATLVPGTILLAVPFLAALRLFANA
jgi:tight adherence protein C